MRFPTIQTTAASLLMLVGLASCGPVPPSDSGTEGPEVTSAGNAKENTPEDPSPSGMAEEIDLSDERLNSPGAGRNPTRAVKDDPAAMDALVGSWASSTESCNSGEAIQFFPDGTYGLEGEGGQWILAGDVLGFEAVTVFESGVEGETSATRNPVQLLAIDAVSMRWQSADGARAEFVRCTREP
jgi:hypothetical protein